jgi:hypothetical protein
MDEEPWFTNWDGKHAALWGNAPVCLQHRVHKSKLFSNDALATLIENYPRQFYMLIHMGEQGQSRRFWREGDIGGLSGSDVIEAIAKGRLWLNLRNVNRVDKRYQELVDALFAELNTRMPDFVTRYRDSGILISSPNAQVYYHADLPGQALFQIAGRKRIYFYPNHKPFLNHADLEHIAIYGVEVEMPYHEWFDQYARIYDFEPGQMFNWPLNAPHRIENHDCLNVSMTVEYGTDAIRRSSALTRANGILRYRLGWTPRSYATHGAAFWTKAMMQQVLRDTQWMKKTKVGRRPIEFKLDRSALGKIVEDKPVSLSPGKKPADALQI